MIVEYTIHNPLNQVWFILSNILTFLLPISTLINDNQRLLTYIVARVVGQPSENWKSDVRDLPCHNQHNKAACWAIKKPSVTFWDKIKMSIKDILDFI